ncbi:MAG: MutS-related protein [Symbiobacteriia bacterium]
MKALLMHSDRDFDFGREPPWNAAALVQDLELNTLWSAMGGDDRFLFEVAQQAVLSSLDDSNALQYRQDVLKDCLQHPVIVRQMYGTAVEAIESEKKAYFGLFMRKSPNSIVQRSTEVLQSFVALLKRLRGIADEHAPGFESEGFSRFFMMLREELDDEYLARVQAHLHDLEFRGGVLVSARLGPGNKGADFVIRRPNHERRSLIERLLTKQPPTFTFRLSERDEAGSRALAELKDKGLNLVGHALAQSVDHILSFFTMLRTELAFYVGCLNLQETLSQLGAPVCFPEPAVATERSHVFTGLYDACLALTLGSRAVGNDLSADDKELAVITGANRGGKSTFLRSIGLSQLMMQCGMFVPAESFRANVCSGVFTHFKREEDTTMTSGKLDEEFQRLSEIADHVRSNGMMLFNESFAATNEREGSEIAEQIVQALVEKRIKVFFVTHFYELAHALYEKDRGNAVFLRAERTPDGGRTFRILEGEPLPTSYGKDLYNRIFGSGPRPLQRPSASQQ